MKISLCMIARDEAQNLDACLASAAPYVDEIVVVDTGSKDATPQIAAKHGARVIYWNAQTQPTEFFVDDDKAGALYGAPPPYSGMIALGNFAGARNASFEASTGDWILWLDSDDTLENGAKLRQVVTELDRQKLDMGFFAYNYARDGQGRVTFRHWRERVIRRGSASWVNPIHEVLLPKPGRGSHLKFDGITVNHHRRGDRVVIPNRNYKNLLRERKRQLDAGDRIDPRLLFYLGQEARFCEPVRALDFYREYLQKSGWGEERAQAHMSIASIHESLAVPGLTVEDARQVAYEHFAIAAAEMPDNPDGLFGMARIAQIREAWADCATLTERALAIGNTESMLGGDPTGRGYLPHLFYNYALSKLGRIEDAARSCRAGLAVCPDDPGGPYGLQPGVLASNLRFYEAHLNQTPSPQQQPDIVINREENLGTLPQPIPPDPFVTWAIQIWKQAFYVERDAEKAARVLDSMPRIIQGDPVVANMRLITSTAQTFNKHSNLSGAGPARPAPNRYSTFGAASVPALSPLSVDLGDRKGTDKTLVLWIGQNVENWDAETPDKTGVGGSETAAASICRELAARGWDVTVYGCPDTERVINGVRYLRWERFAGCDVDVFVSSRDYAPVLRDDVRARAKFLWVHDIHVGAPSAEQERAFLRFDRILCLSEWHKRFFCNAYPTLAEERVVVTRNGIDLERFAAFDLDKPRPNRLIWSSSPPRRLDIALGNLTEIRKQVPDAELHIFYGFETWEKFAIPRGNPAELTDIQRYRDLIAATSGAVYHGRVNQKQLAEGFLSSKVWAYLTDFTETSCITAMEAQASGACVVASRLAALEETVKVGTLIDNTEGSGKRTVDEVVRLLTDDRYWREQALRARAAAEGFSWRGVADDWEALFGEVRQDSAANPIHPWRRAA